MTFLNRYTLAAGGLLMVGLGIWLWGYSSAKERCDAAAVRRELAAATALVDRLRGDHAAAQKLITTLLGERDAIQSDLDATLKEIAQHAPANPSCDPSPDLIRMLDRARTGAGPVHAPG